MSSLALQMILRFPLLEAQFAAVDRRAGLHPRLNEEYGLHVGGGGSRSIYRLCRAVQAEAIASEAEFFC